MPNYDEFYYGISGSIEKWSQPEERDALIRISGAVPHGGSILEIGCGTAAIVPFLRPDINYTGIDVSEFAVEQAKINLRPGAKALLLPAERLPFPARAFDFVLAIHSLEHVPDPQATFKEIIRVLKDHGVIYIRGPNFDWPLSTPNAIRHRSRRYRLWFRIKSVCFYVARLFGYYSFRRVNPNYTEATGRYEKPDDDLRHVMSADETIGYFKRRGFNVAYLNPVPNNISLVKRLITHLPGLHYYGRGMDVLLKR